MCACMCVCVCVCVCVLNLHSICSPVNRAKLNKQGLRMQLAKQDSLRSPNCFHLQYWLHKPRLQNKINKSFYTKYVVIFSVSQVKSSQRLGAKCSQRLGAKSSQRLGAKSSQRLGAKSSQRPPPPPPPPPQPLHNYKILSREGKHPCSRTTFPEASPSMFPWQ